MANDADTSEPTNEQAWACAEEFARNVIQLGRHNGDLRRQLEVAEHHLHHVLQSTSWQQAHLWAQAYFGLLRPSRAADARIHRQEPS